MTKKDSRGDHNNNKDDTTIKSCAAANTSSSNHHASSALDEESAVATNAKEEGVMDKDSSQNPPTPSTLASSSSSSLSPSASRPTSPNTTTATEFEQQESRQQKKKKHMKQQEEEEEGESSRGENNNDENNIQNKKETIDDENGEEDSSCVQVAVRIRPPLASEAYGISSQGEACLSVLGENSIRIQGAQGPRYTFDRVFAPSTLTREIYTSSVQRLVDACLEGYNASILAYGQTGSGKTHTILGPSSFSMTTTASSTTTTASSSTAEDEPEEDMGVLPRAIQALFYALHKNDSEDNNNIDECVSNDNNESEDDESSPLPRRKQNATCEATVRLQFLEIYGEEIRDLLRPSATAVAAGSGQSYQKLTIRDGGRDDEPEVPGASQVVVKTADEAAWAIHRGCLRRVTASTAMNASSSRSHALLTVSLEQRIRSSTRRRTPSASSSGSDCSSAEEDEKELPPTVKRSKFHFVDLAGSERQKRTQAVGQRLKEGIDINKGLLVLGNVISALGGENNNPNQPLFVPYRDSKLTRLLRGSLGGNHKTLMIACVSPSPCNLEESLNCLRYANRAKNIQNKAVVNVDAATKLVVELQDKISLLAKDLLIHVYDKSDGGGDETTDKSSLTFSRQAIQAMAAHGGASGGGPVPSPDKPRHRHHHHHHRSHHHHGHTHHHHSSAPTASSSSPTFESSNSSSSDPQDKKKIQDLELELFRTRQALEQSQKNHDAAEEELYVAKATTQVYQLQEQMTSSDGGGGGEAATSSSMQQAFVQKAVVYEREISDLKKALAAADARAKCMAAAEVMMQPQRGGGTNEKADQLFIERAQRELRADRERLMHLSQSLSDCDRANVDEEETDNANDMAHEQRVMKKYLVQGGMDEDDDEPTDNTDSPANDDTMVKQDQPQSLEQQQEQGPVDNRQNRLLKNDLVELTRGIAAKEDLIDQLKLSQEKYASMRQFYEEKLRIMEESLKSKEDEREQLVRKLNSPRSTADGPLGKKLKEQLREKEQNIADLRRKQKQLRNLTAVSSRNEAEIARLQNDVKDMKRKKVDLQKQLGNERKTHATQVRRLQKEAIQKDRELSKYKRISSQKEMQAQKANVVAKARLDELGSLRAKYKDTQKKLRVQSVKRGVMAKAGLDPILVGKRHHSHRKAATGSNRSSGKEKEQEQHAEDPPVDPDALRELFDQKVSEVVRKEKLVNKLAEEWEEHFVLVNKKEETEEKPDTDNDKDEALQSLGVQIQYKEDRIRQLAKRLAKQQRPAPTATGEGEGEDKTIAEMESFLFDSDFSELSKDVRPELAQKTLSKVLFGMVVRERKRTAALARTASSLDERLQAAEKDTEASVAALNSYIEEQRLQLAEMSQNQQLQILSLMEMVQEDSAHTNSDGDVSYRSTEHSPTATRSDAMLLTLANERISVLENQVQELDTQASLAASKQAKMEELTSELEATSQQKKELEAELLSLKLAMKQIPTSMSPTWATGEEPTDAEVLRIATDALRPTPTSLTPRNRRSPKTTSPTPAVSSPVARSSPDSVRSRSSRRLDNLIEESESDLDDDVPDWAASIVNELAFIAKGEPPPALENSPGFAKQLVEFEKDSVFDRLNDPKNFTGIQKQARVRSVRKPKPLAPNKSPRSQEEKRSRTTRDISGGTSGQSDSSDGPPKHAAKAASFGADSSKHFTFVDTCDSDLSKSSKEYRSVFDKLGSPSHATGTQKQKLAASKKSSSSKNEEDADDTLLDDLLDSHGSAQQGQKSSEKESVFERLQKTATMSSAVKHSGASTSHPPSTDTSPTPAHTRPQQQQQQQQQQRQHLHTSRSEGGEQVANGPTLPSPMEALLSEALGETQPQSQTEHQPDYTSQNVFERLTKTTTEAYAKKVHKIR